VRRKVVISHVAVLMDFAGIVTRYVNSHVISFYQETTGAELLSTWNGNVS
jgi:hypothetical protein